MIEIKIPHIKELSETQNLQQLKELNIEYENICNFSESENDKIYFIKEDSEENIYAVLINTENMSRTKAQEHMWDIFDKYEIYNDCKFVFLPTENENNNVIKLTKTKKDIYWI